MDGGRIVETGRRLRRVLRPAERRVRAVRLDRRQGIPSPVEVATLNARHDGRIVTFSFRDGNDSQAQVFLDLAAAGIGSSSSTAESTTSAGGRSVTSRSR